MRRVNCNILSASAGANTNGSLVDSSELVAASFLASFTDSSAAGTFKLQASNDPTPEGNVALMSGFAPTNWVDIPNQTASISSGAAAILTIPNMSYRWVRAVYTNTAAGAQTITPIADTGVKQRLTVVCVGDVSGSLNNSYFLLSSVNNVTKAQKDFYAWFDNGTGVDPAIAGRTGIQVVYTNDSGASTIGVALRNALNALSSTDFAAIGSVAVIVSNVACGAVPAPTDGAVPTHFALVTATHGVNSNLNNTYFLLQDQGSSNLFYVWMNVDSIGTDPAIGGRTGVPIAFSSSSSAATIGGDLATAIAALNSGNSFTTSGTSTVIVTNKTAGAYTPMSDGTPPTGFAFGISGGTVNVNMLGLSI